jgi:hypothetical protein
LNQKERFVVAGALVIVAVMAGSDLFTDFQKEAAVWWAES